MIIAGVHNDGYPEHHKCGYISDLRKIIAAFTKRDAPERNCTYALIQTLLKMTGEWVAIDGGSIRIKVYKKGTAHLEIHPDLAWQLNEVLAILYPKSIPPEFKTATPKKPKAVNLSTNLIGFDVINLLNDMKPAYKNTQNGWGRAVRIENTYHIRGADDKHLYHKVRDVLLAIGAVEEQRSFFKFDYDPQEAIDHILLTGSIPDKFSHQFYPTPMSLAEMMANKLGTLPGSKILEPSAGIGSLAAALKGDVTCVEVSQLHCKILESRGGYTVINADFLEWAKLQNQQHMKFDGIVMNPPFSLGRAQLHIETAYSLLQVGGKLVALAPKATADRITGTYGHRVIEIDVLAPQSFPGVSIEMAIIVLTR